jgi:MFS family permease
MMVNDSGEKPSQWMFWGCFIALITTAFAFITRAFMVNTPSMWPADFGLDKVQGQVLFGHGIWPFAISIILFSLVIDKIGYRVAMFFSFACYAVYALLALSAYAIVKEAGLAGDELIAARKSGLFLLTIGSIVLGLGNGTVEAFINPVVATMFSKEKTKWLNILHAGWPGGLVLGGLITLGLGSAANDWRNLIYIIAIPAVVYLLMLVAAKFPVNERVSSGATYREMLAEFGFLGAALAVFLVIKQLAGVYNDNLAGSVAGYFTDAKAADFAISDWMVYGLVAIISISYGIYCQSLGRPMLFLLCAIMMPLATTELGTDGAISGIMEKPMEAAGYSPLWVLIYTSGIMMVLRFFAGPVVKALTPLGLLATCAALAIVGLYWLSFAQTVVAIFVAATVYGIAKTYFWPTMLGVVAEQYPKGGALTLNAIAGIGMLTVGVLGGPLIGKMQEDSAKVAIDEKLPGVYAQIQTSPDPTYFLGTYQAIDDDKVKAMPEEKSQEVTKVVSVAKQGALAKVIVFPIFMLVCYIGMILYFQSIGGYKPVDAAANGGGH